MRKTVSLSLVFLIVGTFGFAQSFLNLARSGTVAQIQAALDAGARIDQCDSDGETPLMYAAAFNQDPSVIYALIEAGASVEDRDNDQFTALMWAARNNSNPAVVLALLKAGASVEDRDRDQSTALMMAAGYNSNLAVLSALLAAGAKADDRNGTNATALMMAAGNNTNPSVISALLAAGPTIDDENMALLCAVETNMNPVVVSVLLKSSAGIETKDPSGLSLLMHAASFSKSPAVISALIAAGAKIEERGGSTSETALMFAAQNNMNVSVIETLLDAGADVQASNSAGMTPILMAGGYNGNPEVISLLIKSGAKISDRNRAADTALHFAAANNTNPAMISTLVKAGAEVDEPDIDGRTALIVAAQNTKTPAVIEALLTAGADPKRKDNEGRIAFDYAKENKSLEGTKARWDLDITHSLSKGLLIVQDRFYDIYPAFYSSYDTHPLGQVVIMNTTDKPVSGVRMSFFVKEFMDAPQDCPVPSTLQPNEPATVDLFTVFQQRILQVTENMKVNAEVTLEYIENGQPQKKVIWRTFPVLKRNALNWDDTRKAAAFVSPSDPTVLRFAKNVSFAVGGKTNPAIDRNLTLAIAVHDALRLYGLSYSQDPIPALTVNSNVADFMQFPRQTLENHSGKCGDLSVLYSALLEAVGVETAFITTPGHIFIAVALGMGEEEARKFFDDPGELIFQNGKVWLPLELTLLEGDFLKSWREGAQEWRENMEKGQAAMCLLHEAWKSYEPVAFPGVESAINPPAAKDIVQRVQNETASFVKEEISTREATLQGQIAKEKDSSRPLNALGILYARYGMWDRAEAQFSAALAKQEDFHVLVNFGNLFFVKGDAKKASIYYARASQKNPASASALLGLLRCYEASGDQLAEKKTYEKLKTIDAGLAVQFAYVENLDTGPTRASEVGKIREMPWEEE